MPGKMQDLLENFRIEWYGEAGTYQSWEVSDIKNLQALTNSDSATIRLLVAGATTKQKWQ